MPMPRYINMNRSGERERFALQMFTDFGITAFRLNTDGQVSWIKDANLGWLSADKWLLMNRVKEALTSPIASKIIQGGYRINAALYNAEVSAATVTVPIGKIVIVAAVSVLVVAAKAGDWETVLFILAGLVAPFGAIILVWMFAEWIEHFMNGGATLELGDVASFDPIRGLIIKKDGIEWSPISGFLGPIFSGLFGGGSQTPASTVAGPA